MCLELTVVRTGKDVWMGIVHAMTMSSAMTTGSAIARRRTMSILPEYNHTLAMLIAIAMHAGPVIDVRHRYLEVGLVLTLNMDKMQSVTAIAELSIQTVTTATNITLLNVKTMNYVRVGVVLPYFSMNEI
jgi:hypothetical protein